ncbi:unnamed protein product [Rotaria socialis]|nr:unnamed protein product [Rotaria socialis]CAF4606292.1 unnamed protein product [Rotaria socialis]
MLVYIQADIQRLQRTTTIDSNQCIQRYARETLCPICVSSTSSPSSFSNQINNDNDISEALCENDCRYIIRTCFNETNDPYLVFASMAKNYSDILEEMEQIVIELKLVERLAKLHIYLYDMVVNTTNSRQIYMELHMACPNQYVKSFSPIISLPPAITERRELVFQWNKSLHVLLKRTHSSIHNLEAKFTKKLMTGICSNAKYVSKSDGCTQIDKQIINLIQWPLPSISKPILNVNNAELTRNQLDELKKKMIPIQQMTTSLQPKKKIALIEYIPDFESYNDDISITDYDTDFSTSLESDDADIQGSLSERLYSEIDGLTTRRSKVTTTKKNSQQKTSSKAVSIAYSLPIYLTIFIIKQL